MLPRRWKDEFGNDLEARRLPGFLGELDPTPVLGNGNIVLHTYRKRWRQYLQRGRFDAIYINHEPYGLATAQVLWANQRGARVPAGFYSCQNIEKHYPIPFRWLEAMVYQLSRFAFPITEQVAGVLRRKGFRGDITVAPLPVDTNRYAPDTTRKRPVTIGYVGRVVEAKGLRTLARGLELIRDLDWRFELIGAGPFLGELKSLIALAHLTDRVSCAGYVAHDEMPRRLARFDILVLPSETQANWKEQFGRVIPEALACGAAVVGSDSGEIPRLIEASGGGLVFPERDASALAGALRRLVNDGAFREELACRGREWVCRCVSLPVVASQMATTIQSARSET